MSDVLASVSVVLGAEISGFKAAMAQARKELSGLVKFSEGLKDIGQSLTQYVSLPLAAFGAAAVAASAKVESLGKGLQAITLQELGKQGVTGLAAVQQAATLTAERMKELQVVARQPGLGFEAAVAGDVRLRAVGISAEQSAKSIKAFANAVATTGGGKGEFDRITVQLAQLSAKGKVLAQDLRPIIEAAPAVSGALQKLYGTVDSETISASLKKQGQSSTDFIRVLTDELGKLPQVSGGLKNAFENLTDTGTLALAKFGDGISKALNIPAVAQSLSNGITRLADGFANLSPGVQHAIVVLGTLAAAAGPVLVAIGTLGAALPALTAGFATFGISSVAALGPLALAAAGVAAAAYLIYDNWSSITAYFQPSGEGGRLFGDLAESIGNSVKEIKLAVGQLGSLGGDNFGDLISAGGVVKDLFRELAVGARAFSDVAGGTIGFVANLLSGEFVQAELQAERALKGLAAPLANLLGFDVSKDRGVGGVKELFAELAASAAKAAEGVDYFAEEVTKTATTGGILEGLRLQLKNVKEAREAATSAIDITADNKLIKSLEAQIAKLEGVDKQGKKATDALAHLRQELNNNANASLALGSLFQYLPSQAKSLESGIKALTDNGFSPSGKVVRGYVSQLRELNAVLGDNAQLAPRLIKGYELKELDNFKKYQPDLKVAIPELKPVKIEPYAIVPGSMEKLTGLVALAGSRIDKIQKEFLGSFVQAQIDFNAKSQAIADAFPTSAFVSIGQSIGSALGSGADVLAAAGAAIIRAFASYAEQQGELLIALGASNLFIPGAQALGALQVGAGLALVAAAGVGTAFASSIGSSDGISSSLSSTNYSPATPNYGQNSSSTQKIQVEVLLRGRGRDLVAVGRSEEFRSLISV